MCGGLNHNFEYEKYFVASCLSLNGELAVEGLVIVPDSEYHWFIKKKG